MGCIMVARQWEGQSSGSFLHPTAKVKITDMDCGISLWWWFPQVCQLLTSSLRLSVLSRGNCHWPVKRWSLHQNKFDALSKDQGQNFNNIGIRCNVFWFSLSVDLAIRKAMCYRQKGVIHSGCISMDGNSPMLRWAEKQMPKNEFYIVLILWGSEAKVDELGHFAKRF